LDGLEGFIGQAEVLLVTDILDELEDICLGELIEPDTQELILQGLVHLGNIVTYQAKPDIVRRGLEDIFEGLLGVLGHIVHFVQDDKLEPFFKEVLGFGKLMNLVTDNINPPFIRGIQMDDITLVDTVIPVLELVDEINDGRGFSRPRGAIKQQVREVVFVENILEQFTVEGVQDNILEVGRAVFFHPGDGRGGHGVGDGVGGGVGSGVGSGVGGGVGGGVGSGVGGYRFTVMGFRDEGALRGRRLSGTATHLGWGWGWGWGCGRGGGSGVYVQVVSLSPLGSE
jgi:hypothetical protein